MMAQPTTTINATIDRINGHGFQIKEQPGKWLNLSKFARPEPVVPPVGTEVEITLDPQGFVRDIEPTGPEPDYPEPDAHADRASIMTRLACLSAAAGFLASRPNAKSGDVLRVAENWEGWVTR
jgi:hypothetical protein